MGANLDGLFTDFILTTFRTFGQLSSEAVQEALEGVDLDRHLTNLLTDQAVEVMEVPEFGQSIVLKPITQLITEVTGKEPGTKAFAMAHSKKPAKKKGAVEPVEQAEAVEAGTAEKKQKATLKEKWTGTPEELERHLSQVWSFNLAHLMFEEEGKRDQGHPPSLRYFAADEAVQLDALEGEAKHAAWLLGLERPDKDHLEMVVCVNIGKVRIKWAFAGIHLIISDWRPVPQVPMAVNPMEALMPLAMAAEVMAATPRKRGRPPKVVAAPAEAKVAPAVGAKAKAVKEKATKPKPKKTAAEKLKNPRKGKAAPNAPVSPDVATIPREVDQAPATNTLPAEVQPLAVPTGPVLEMATKDEQGQDLAPKKRYFYFKGNTNAKARLSQIGLRKALLVMGEPSAEVLLHKTDLVAIPPAFIDAAKPRTMVEVIQKARELAMALPDSGPKLRRKAIEQKDMEELAQILINLEPNKTPAELAAKMKHLMGFLDAAVAQAEAWERDNQRDKDGKIRQRWEKGKPRPGK